MSQTRTVTVGPNATTPADTPWLRLDDFGGGVIAFQCVVAGAATYSVQTSFDDPNDLTRPIAPGSMTWDSLLTGVSGATASTSGTFFGIPRYIKANLASGTGSVAMTVSQSEG